MLSGILILLAVFSGNISQARALFCAQIGKEAETVSPAVDPNYRNFKSLKLHDQVLVLQKILDAGKCASGACATKDFEGDLRPTLKFLRSNLSYISIGFVAHGADHYSLSNPETRKLPPSGGSNNGIYVSRNENGHWEILKLLKYEQRGELLTAEDLAGLSQFEEMNPQQRAALPEKELNKISSLRVLAKLVVKQFADSYEMAEIGGPEVYDIGVAAYTDDHGAHQLSYFVKMAEFGHGQETASLRELLNSQASHELDKVGPHGRSVLENMADAAVNIVEKGYSIHDLQFLLNKETGEVIPFDMAYFLKHIDGSEFGIEVASSIVDFAYGELGAEESGRYGRLFFRRVIKDMKESLYFKTHPELLKEVFAALNNQMADYMGSKQWQRAATFLGLDAQSSVPISTQILTSLK